MDNKEFVIRLEEEKDYNAVENLIRESFWNVYRPGCYEHLVMHNLRKDPSFIKELDFVMEQNGKIIGQNTFAKTIIKCDNGKDIDILTMGPICIDHELQRKGYGKILLDYTLSKAAEMNYGAVLFEGNILFYGKSGFVPAKNFGIRYNDFDENEDTSFFLCKELMPSFLNGITGSYRSLACYLVDKKDVEEFDKGFPPKEKLKLPGQLFDE